MISEEVLGSMLTPSLVNFVEKSYTHGMRYAVVSIRSGRLLIEVLTSSYGIACAICNSLKSHNTHVTLLADILSARRCKGEEYSGNNADSH